MPLSLPQLFFPLCCHYFHKDCFFLLCGTTTSHWLILSNFPFLDLCRSRLLSAGQGQSSFVQLGRLGSTQSTTCKEAQFIPDVCMNYNNFLRGRRYMGSPGQGHMSVPKLGDESQSYPNHTEWFPKVTPGSIYQIWE